MKIRSSFLLFLLPLVCSAQDDPSVVVLCKANEPKCYTIKYLGLENNRDGKVCCNDFVLNEKWFCWDDCTSNRLPQAAPNVEMDSNGQLVIDGEIIGRLAQPGPNPQMEVHYTNSGDWLRVETQKEVGWEIRKGNLYIEDAFICPISGNSLGKFIQGQVEIREISKYAIPKGELNTARLYIQPNPVVNKRMNIWALLPQDGEVSFDLFNMNGQHMSLLSNPKYEKAGLIFRECYLPSGIPSGLYVLRMRNGNYFSTSQIFVN